MENKKNKIIITILIVLAVVIVVGFTMYIENKQKVKPKDNTVTVTAIDDEEFYSNIEKEQEERFENDYGLIETFLDIYNVRATGWDVLYTLNGNNMYSNEQDRNEKFKKSEETIVAGANTYVAYSTQIKYDTYRQNLLKIMSEELFEKYFSEYTKNIDGMLYITNEQKFPYIIIDSLEKIDENQYSLMYEQDGEVKEAIVTIDENRNIIKQINI